MTRRCKANRNFMNEEWWQSATPKDVLDEISKGADVNCIYEDYAYLGIYHNKKHYFEILKILFENGLDVEKELILIFRNCPLNEAIYFLEQKDTLKDNTISNLFCNLSMSDFFEKIEYLLKRYQNWNFSQNDLENIASVKDEKIVSIFFDTIVLPRKNDLKAMAAVAYGARYNKKLLNLLLSDIFNDSIPEDIFKDIIIYNAQDKEMVHKFLNKGIDKNIQDSSGYTVLNRLTYDYSRETHGHYKSDESKTKLKLKQLHDDILYWIDFGVDVNIPCNSGSTPLLNMCEANIPPLEVLEIISKLISKGADVNVERKDYTNTPLSKLYRVTPTNNDTPLYDAINRNQNSELINLLLDSGANVNAFTRNEEESIIDAALKNKCDVKIIDKILKSGISDYYKMRGFLRCINEKYSREIFDTFISNGINVNEKFTGYIRSQWMVEEYTPLMMACISGNMEFCKLLIDLGADMYVKDVKGRSLLSIACSSSSDAPFIEYLISLGFDVNEQDNDGNTPLMLRLMNWNLADIFNVLMTNGADINKRNYNGDNILLLKMHSLNYRTNICDVLVKCGADVTIVNNNGEKVNEWLISLHEKTFNTVIDRTKIDEEVAKKLKEKEKNKKNIDKSFFKDKVVCFAGFKNKKLSDYIKKHGGKYVTSVTDDCNLVIRNNSTWLTTKGDVLVSIAVEKVIPIISLGAIKDKIREYGDIEEI